MIRKLSVLALAFAALVGVGASAASAAPAPTVGATIILAFPHPQEDGLWWP